MILPPVLQQAYDASRRLEGQPFRAACYAPYVSMLFDSLGNVRVCCKNFQFLLGNVAQQRLPEIWNGAAAERLRQAMRAYDLGQGCEHCQWQIRSDSSESAFARIFDDFPAVEGPEGFQPRQLEFSLSNACNLACQMCNGEFSSTIRARVERLPPLPRFYGDQFFDDLRPLLGGLRRAKFSGGEPFLAPENFRIWDLMLAEGQRVSCDVTTNATVWNDRVAQVLAELPVNITVSLDGVRRDTFEAIRVGASFEVVLANLHRFHEICRARGTALELNHCLMRQNWREFGEFLLFADAHDVNAYVCTVVFPASCSLYTLPRAELLQVVEELERQQAALLPRLGRNRAAWLSTLAGLRGQAQAHGVPRPEFAALRVLEPFGPQPAASTESEPNDLTALAPGGPLAQPWIPATLAELIGAVPAAGRWCEELAAWGPDYDLAWLACDRQDRVVALEPAARGFFGLEREICLGRRLDTVLAQLRVRLGGGTAVEILADQPDLADRVLRFYASQGSRAAVRLVTLPVPQLGIWALTLAALRHEPDESAVTARPEAEPSSVLAETPKEAPPWPTA